MISQWVNIKESINSTFLNLKLRYHLQMNVKRNTNLFSITILQKPLHRALFLCSQTLYYDRKINNNNVH